MFYTLAYHITNNTTKNKINKTATGSATFSLFNTLTTTLRLFFLEREREKAHTFPDFGRTTQKRTRDIFTQRRRKRVHSSA
jgi:hypothetical protein